MFYNLYRKESHYIKSVNYKISALEYTSPVWNPWYKEGIEKLEKVQRKCLQLSFFLSLYTAWRSLSSIIGRCTLYTPGCTLCSKEIVLDSLDKRTFANCFETYKYVHNQYKNTASVYFKHPARE